MRIRNYDGLEWHVTTAMVGAGVVATPSPTISFRSVSTGRLVLAPSAVRADQLTEVELRERLREALQAEASR